ncbi:MAG: hypothetical protein ACR652_08210 [Methylocystis sp.]|uniref:hypothetical protein n=1 Tax=Methylocystis sp. TaxID=1911079 RepID=UPI003DA2E283
MATISDYYRDLQTDLHRNPHYGVASLEYAPLVAKVFSGVGAESVADYGAGKCNLRKGLEALGLKGFDYFPYDPVFPEYGAPREADLVCCIDVLEHIEEDYIDSVIADLVRITTNYGFFTIATGPAEKILADGRNAHLTQKPTSWWLPKFLRAFNIEQLQNDRQGFWFIVTPISGPRKGGVTLPTISLDPKPDARRKRSLADRVKSILGGSP